MISVEVRVRVRLRIRLRDRDWVISDATNNTTSRTRDQFSSTRGTSRSMVRHSMVTENQSRSQSQNVTGHLDQCRTNLSGFAGL